MSNSTSTSETRSWNASPSSPSESPSKTTYKQDTPRPLLPQPRLLALTVSDSAKGADTSLRRLRNNISLACNECKLKRARCNGSDPCSQCEKKGLNCRYNPGKDRRRIRAHSDRIAKYQRLFNTLRNTSSAEAIRLLHCIRSLENDF